TALLANLPEMADAETKALLQSLRSLHLGVSCKTNDHYIVRLELETISTEVARLLQTQLSPQLASVTPALDYDLTVEGSTLAFRVSLPAELVHEAMQELVG